MEPKKANDPDELGGWRINGRLGEGGFGTVFLAEKGAQKAAIKVIREEYVQEIDARNRLATEAEVLSKLSDPSIGKILDSDLSGQFPWIATEFINGPTLDNKVKYEGPLEEISWFNLAANIFHAIITANEYGVIHKDIKPSNIILGETGNKLIDFGIAHISGQTRTATFGDREGSTPFSSPEHFTIKANQKMDVFSTAATLGYAAKGNSIWKGENDLQLMRSINEDDPDLEGLSENQKRFLIPLLEKNPSDRPSAIEAHQSALGYIEFLLGRTKKPHPLKSRNKFKKIVRSKVAILGFALALVTGIGMAASLAGFSIIPLEIRSLFTKDNVDFTLAQNEKISSCKNLVASGDYASAVVICKETAELGDDWSQYSLGFALDKLGNEKEAANWVLKAAEQKMPEALSWMAYDALEENDYSKALDWAKQAAELGDLPGVHAVGLAYGYLEEYDLAAEWYEKAWNLGDALGLINLGYHYRFDSVDKVKAEKWLKLAAETPSTYQPDGAFEYAEFLRGEGRKSSEFCPWYKKSAEAKFKEEDKDAVKAFQEFCPVSKVLPDPIKSALLSSDELTVSPPMDANVKISSIFGRVFKDSGMVWRIILSNSNSQPVPPINGIEVRIVGYEDAGWFRLPYKLKKDPQVESVYAAVDDLFLSVLFKRSVCPEFRAVREENGKLVNIWTKGLPECSNDYLP
jgi:serine/threonine protein kinase